MCNCNWVHWLVTSTSFAWKQFKTNTPKKKNMVYIIHLIQLVARKKEHQKLYHLESRWRNSHESWFIMAPYPNPPYLGVASHLLSKWYTHDIPTSTPCLIYSVTINKLREPLAFPLRISVEPRQNRTIFGWFNCESLRTVFGWLVLVEATLETALMSF